MSFFFLVKWVYHKLYIFQFQIFDTNWPSLVYSTYSIFYMEMSFLTSFNKAFHANLRTYNGLDFKQQSGILAGIIFW